jgi:hypothetical protein
MSVSSPFIGFKLTIPDLSMVFALRMHLLGFVKKILGDLKGSTLILNSRIQQTVGVLEDCHCVLGSYGRALSN